MSWRWAQHCCFLYPNKNQHISWWILQAPKEPVSWQRPRETCGGWCCSSGWNEPRQNRCIDTGVLWPRHWTKVLLFPAEPHVLTSAVPVAAACGAIERGGAQLSLKPGVLSQYFLIRCFKCLDSKLILNRWELHELLALNGRSEQRFPAESGATAWPLGLDFPYCCQWQGGSQKNGVSLLPLCHHQKDSENSLETGTLRGTSCPHLFAGSYDSPGGS